MSNITSQTGWLFTEYKVKNNASHKLCRSSNPDMCSNDSNNTNDSDDRNDNSNNLKGYYRILKYHNTWKITFSNKPTSITLCAGDLDCQDIDTYQQWRPNGQDGQPDFGIWYQGRITVCSRTANIC